MMAQPASPPRPETGLTTPPPAAQVLLIGLAGAGLLLLAAWLVFRREPLVDHERPPAATIRFSLDINTAGVAELSQLPGIGPALAERIIKHRQAHGSFRSIAAVAEVSGIGPVTLEQIRPFLRPLPPTPDRG